MCQEKLFGFHLPECRSPLVESLVSHSHTYRLPLYDMTLTYNDTSTFTFRWLTCKDVSPESSQKLMATVEDRCRLPWLYGAIQIKLDVVLPMLAVPSGLLLASVSLFWTVVTAVIFPPVLLLFYRVWTRQLRHRRSQLFYIWGVTSLVVTYYIFLVVVSYREILAWEMLLESSLFMLTLSTLYHARKTPGVMTQSLVKKQQRQPWKNQWNFQPLDGNTSGNNNNNSIYIAP